MNQMDRSRFFNGRGLVAMLAVSLSGCTVLAVGGAMVGTAVSVTGAVVSTGVALTGKALGAGIDALSDDEDESADDSGIVIQYTERPASAAPAPLPPAPAASAPPPAPGPAQPAQPSPVR